MCKRPSGRSFCVKSIVRKILNVGLKNFVSECNNEINSNRKRELGISPKECRVSKKSKEINRRIKMEICIEVAM